MKADEVSGKHFGKIVIFDFGVIPAARTVRRADA